jgi:hypothetical protein
VKGVGVDDRIWIIPSSDKRCNDDDAEDRACPVWRRRE